jgi:ElaB/YqjD/DUF883 family membrane-anchored ribosome-binding protein
MGETADLIQSGKGKEPEEIRAEIEQTRAEVSETIDEIKERLSSEHLKVRVRDATIGRVKEMMETTATKAKEWSSQAVEGVRNNPLPYALIGAGVGVGIGAMIWFLSRRKGESLPEEEGLTGDFPGPEEPSEEGRLKEFGTTAKERAGEIAGRAKGRARELGSEARERSTHLKSRFEEAMESNPLAVGAALFTLGTIVGLSIPVSNRERRLMGKTRDNLLARAEERVHEAMDKAESAALES